VAKSAHAATIDKAQHAFATTGIYRYRPNITSDEDFKPSEVTRKKKMSDENLEGTEERYSNVDSPLRVDGPDLPTLASPRSPDYIATTRKYNSYYHSSIKPIAKTSVEGKERKKKSQESEILPGTPYKTFIESKEKDKESKMKGKAERQLKGLEEAQKTEKSGSQKIGQGQNLAFPCHPLPHLHQPLVRDVERDSRMTGPVRKLTGMVACGLFQLGRRWQLPVRPLLNLMHAHLYRPRYPRVRILQTFFKTLLQSLHTFPVNFHV
jgi:hypothetical protein